MGWWMYWSKDVEERVKTSKVVCGCSVKKDMSVAVFLFFFFIVPLTFRTAETLKVT